MKIKLTDGTELNALGVHGRTINYQGVQRDSLIFLFDPQAITLEQVCTAFVAENCQSITIEDSSGTYIHENYTIRVEVGCGYKDMALTGGVGNDMTQCVYVRMAQSTLAEREIQQQQEIIDMLLVAALETEG